MNYLTIQRVLWLGIGFCLAAALYHFAHSQ
jgi:hypothetical protein